MNLKETFLLLNTGEKITGINFYCKEFFLYARNARHQI